MGERAYREDCKPRPVAIDVDGIVIPIRQITWWRWIDGRISILVQDGTEYFSDPDRKIDAALRQLFRTVSP